MKGRLLQIGLVLAVAVGASFVARRWYFGYWWSCADQTNFVHADTKLLSTQAVTYRLPDGPMEVWPEVAQLQRPSLAAYALNKDRDAACNCLVLRQMSAEGIAFEDAGPIDDLEFHRGEFEKLSPRLLRAARESRYLSEHVRRFDSKNPPARNSQTIMGQLYELQDQGRVVYAWELRAQVENDHYLREVVAVRDSEIIYQHHFYQDVAGLEALSIFVFVGALGSLLAALAVFHLLRRLLRSSFKPAAVEH